MLTVSDTTAILCFDDTTFVLVGTQVGAGAFEDRIPVNIRPQGIVTEARAVVLDQGILIVWTEEVRAGTRFGAALVSLDGKLLAPEVTLPAARQLLKFNLVGLGSSAWLTFVREDARPSCRGHARADQRQVTS